MNFIINVLRERKRYHILSNQILYPSQNQILSCGGSKLGMGGGTTKNISVNILAVTFQASNQEIPKSNLKNINAAARLLLNYIAVKTNISTSAL